jgi:hypothetical protein
METSQMVKTERVCAQLIQLTQGYRIRRDLDNKVIDVLQAKLAYEVLKFLSRKQLCEAFSRPVSSRLPLDTDSASVYLVAKPNPNPKASFGCNRCRLE